MKSKYFIPSVISKLENIELKAKLVVEGFMAGLHKSPYFGYNIEFAEHRPYNQGDEIRHIDWKVFGRTDKLYIKQFEEETNLKAYILLDISKSMDFKSPDKDSILKIEYGSYIAATLSYLMLKQGDYVGLLCFDDKIKKYLPPRGSIPHIRNILYTLDTIKPGQKTNISKIFHTLAERIKRRGLIIIISDLLDIQEDIISGIKHFKHQKHEVLVFHILDNAEYELPFKGSIKYIDSETGKSISTFSEGIRDEYKKRFYQWINYFKFSLGASKIDYLPINTKTTFDIVLLKYLEKRKKLYR